MMGQNEATVKRCRHITAGVLEGAQSKNVSSVI